MNLINTKQNQTMSSREIAELTGKEHRNVCRDVRNMLDTLNLDALSFEHIYFDGSNREQIEYHLPKDLTLTLVSGYDIALRYKVVKKLEEYELGYVKPQMDALEFAEYHLAQMKEKREIEIQLLEAQPKARAFEELTSAPGGYLIGDAAKVLELPPKYFRKLLLNRFRWIFKTPRKSYSAYETSIKSGYMCHRLSGGSSVPMVTAKGIAKIKSILHTQLILALDRIAI